MVRSTALIVLATAFGVNTPASADLISNASIDDWMGTAPADTPDGWGLSNPDVVTEVASLSGPGSAAFFSNNFNMTQVLSSDITGEFVLGFDFQIATTNGGGPDRGMNMTLREGLNPIFNVRTSAAGDLQFFDGGWQSISSAATGIQSEQVNFTDVYRVEVSGDISGTAGYDVTLLNVTDGTTAASATGLTFFQNDPTGGTAIDLIRFDRGNGDYDWTLDNVSIAVPEPGSLALIALGGSLLLANRRG